MFLCNSPLLPRPRYRCHSDLGFLPARFPHAPIMDLNFPCYLCLPSVNLQKGSNWPLKRAKRENRADKGWAIKLAVHGLTPFCPDTLVSSPNLYPPTISSVEASLCRREAREKKKRKRAGHDGKGEKSNALYSLPINSRVFTTLLSLLVKASEVGNNVTPW